MQSDGRLLTSVLVAGALCLHHGPALPAAAEPESSKYQQIEFIEEIVHCEEFSEEIVHLI